VTSVRKRLSGKELLFALRRESQEPGLGLE